MAIGLIASSRRLLQPLSSADSSLSWSTKFFSSAGDFKLCGSSVRPRRPLRALRPVGDPVRGQKHVGDSTEDAGQGDCAAHERAQVKGARQVGLLHVEYSDTPCEQAKSAHETDAGQREEHKAQGKDIDL